MIAVNSWTCIAQVMPRFQGQWWRIFTVVVTLRVEIGVKHVRCCITWLLAGERVLVPRTGWDLDLDLKTILPMRERC